MPELTKVPAGSFCWTELNTTDPAAARKFYAEVLGWTYADMPMPDGSPYAMAKVGNASTAGIRVLGEDAKKMGAPPNWLSYIATTDTDASVAKATKAGGKVLAPAMDAGPMGRMAVVADPTGGVFAFWQEKQSMGSFLYGENGALSWNELATTNVDAAGKFYSTVFGWKADTMAMPGNTQYTTFKNGEAFTGGMMAMPADMKGVPTMWTAYFHVANVDAQIAKATKLGGQVVVPPQDVPNVGRFAYLKDPQGAVFALIKFAPPATK